MVVSSLALLALLQLSLRVLGQEIIQDEWSLIMDVVARNCVRLLGMLVPVVLDRPLVEFFEISTNQLDRHEHVLVADVTLLDLIDCVNEGLNSDVSLWLFQLSGLLPGSWSHFKGM